MRFAKRKENPPESLNEYMKQRVTSVVPKLWAKLGERKLLKTHKIRRENLFSGFFRYEKYLQNLTLYAGLGHAQRMPDHWETNKDAKLALNKERNTQLDFGAVLKDQNYELNANFFVSKMDDYIMLKYNPIGMSSSAFNTDALLYGGEIEGTTLLADMFRLGAGVSYVYGKVTKNAGGLKDGDALPKISPQRDRKSVV